MLSVAPAVRAQGPPPKIGPFVLDVHGIVPRFPSTVTLAASRDLFAAELPGRGLGAQVGAHLYFLRWRQVTLGFGGEVATSRARNTPPDKQTTTSTLRATQEKFTEVGTQLSFNFGTGYGWSYISGGIGRSTWSVIPDGRAAFPSDLARLKTLNYGGGARWFAKKHLAFSLDVRLYEIKAGVPQFGLPGSPRTLLLVVGAGVSFK